VFLPFSHISSLWSCVGCPNIKALYGNSPFFPCSFVTNRCLAYSDNSVSPRSCRDSSLLRIHDHFPADYLYADRCSFQYELYFFIGFRFKLMLSFSDAVQQIVKQIGKASFNQIIQNLHSTCRPLLRMVSVWLTGWSALPETINSTYINQSSYWLTFFPWAVINSCPLLWLWIASCFVGYVDFLYSLIWHKFSICFGLGFAQGRMTTLYVSGPSWTELI
jgi:hypothetical protein